MKTKNIGNISKDLLIFGGAYGNLQALQKVKSIARAKGFGPEQVFFTGDAAAYCAHPEQCIQIIKNWGIHAIAGNVEIQLREGRNDCGCNFENSTTCDRLSRQWYPYVQQHVSASSIEWMNVLPDTIQLSMNGYSIHIVHGSYTNVSRYIFESSGWSVKQKEFEAAGSDIIIGGHCGIPFSDQRNNKLWINAGAIGMPANDGTARVWYLTVELQPSGGILFNHHSYTYNNIRAPKAMKAKNLPQEYIQPLTNGIWDNCDILPAQETRQQGMPLRLAPISLS